MAELQALLLTAGLFGFVVAGVVEFVATMIVFSHALGGASALSQIPHYPSYVIRHTDLVYQARLFALVWIGTTAITFVTGLVVLGAGSQSMVGLSGLGLRSVSANSAACSFGS